MGSAGLRRFTFYPDRLFAAGMKKGLATRTAIIDEALRQASLVGLEGLSLAPLADSLALSKSGLFAHFRSKEALQIEVLETAIERFKRDVLAPQRRAETVERRLNGIFARWLDWIKSGGDRGGCVFMTVAQEYDDRPGPVRDVLVESQKSMRAFLTDVIRDGIGDGSFRDDIDPEQWVFELYGIALSFQHAANLLADPHAKRRALEAMRRLIGLAKPVSVDPA